MALASLTPASRPSPTSCAKARPTPSPTWC